MCASTYVHTVCTVPCVLAHTVCPIERMITQQCKSKCVARIIGLSEVGVHWKELRQNMLHAVVVQPVTQSMSLGEVYVP